MIKGQEPATEGQDSADTSSDNTNEAQTVSDEFKQTVDELLNDATDAEKEYMQQCLDKDEAPVDTEGEGMGKEMSTEGMPTD